jgi:hypothetical protein
VTGIIGVIANDAARFSQFTACLVQLDRPEGAEVEVMIGGDWCAARNNLARATIEGGHDWLWFMDDDHVFAPEMLNRLLSHDRPLVTPLCLTRQAPFRPVQFTERIPDADKQYLPIPLDRMTGKVTELVKLEAGGCAGMLIRREVLEAIPDPWFEYADRSEDIIFCEKAKAAGFDLWCDLRCRLGHIAVAVVEPAVVGDGWAIGLTVGGRDGLRLAVSFDDNPKGPR